MQDLRPALEPRTFATQPRWNRLYLRLIVLAGKVRWRTLVTSCFFRVAFKSGVAKVRSSGDMRRCLGFVCVRMVVKVRTAVVAADGRKSSESRLCSPWAPVEVGLAARHAHRNQDEPLDGFPQNAHACSISSAWVV